MTDHFHTVAWVDHREAHIIGFNWDTDQKTIVRHHNAPHKIHHKAGLGDSGHTHEDKTYLQAIAHALEPSGEILIVGPGAAHTQLLKYLGEKFPDTARKVVGFGALDHPTDGELLDYARRFFRAADHKTPQKTGT